MNSSLANAEFYFVFSNYIKQVSAIARPAASQTAFPDVATPADLAKLPLVLHEVGGNTRRIVDRRFARAGVGPMPVMNLESVEAIKEMAGAGLGAGVPPQTAIRETGDRFIYRFI